MLCLLVTIGIYTQRAKASEDAYLALQRRMLSLQDQDLAILGGIRTWQETGNEWAILAGIAKARQIADCAKEKE